MALAKQAAWIGRELAGNRYLIRAALGEGGMGAVYRAWDRNLETEVVIKVPRLAMLEDPGFAERFSREIRSLVKLTHPHIVKVLDVGSHDDVPFAVMQYLGGGSLEMRRRSFVDSQGRCPAESLRGWLPEIAQALDFLHGQGFLHRDVKPANILFDEHHHAYLSDFGIIKALTEAEPDARSASLTGTGMVLGTPHYMAPEMVTGAKADGRADQYSLAVVAFEMLTGRFPINGPTPTAILVAQSTQSPIPLEQVRPDLDPGLARALMRGLAKRPEERFGRCGELAQAALAGIGRGSGTIPPAMPKSKPPLGTGTRRSAIVVGGTPCPVCQAKLGVQPSHAGKRLRCRGCQTRLVVSHDLSELSAVLEPSHSELVPGSPPDTDRHRGGAATLELTPFGPDLAVPVAPERLQPRIPTSPKEKRPGPMILVLGGGVVAALLLCWGVIYWVRGTNSDRETPSIQDSATMVAKDPTSPLPPSDVARAPAPNAESTPDSGSAAESGPQGADAASPVEPGSPPSPSPPEPSPDPAPPAEPAPIAVAQLTEEQRERIRRGVGKLTVKKAEGGQVQVAGILIEKPRVLATQFLPLPGAETIQVEWCDGTSDEVSGFFHCDPRLNLALLTIDRRESDSERGIPLADTQPAAGDRLLVLDGRFEEAELATRESAIELPTPERIGEVLVGLTHCPWGERAFRCDASWLLSAGGAGVPANAVGWFNGAGEVVGLVWPAGDAATSAPQVALTLSPSIPKGKAWQRARRLEELPPVQLLTEYLTSGEPLGKLRLGEEVLDLRTLGPGDLTEVKERLADSVGEEKQVVQLPNENGSTAAYFSYANDAKGLSRLDGDSMLLDDEERPLLLCQYKQGQREGMLVLCHEDGGPWVVEQRDRGKQHGWSVVFRHGLPWLIRQFRYGTEQEAWVLVDGWLTTVRTATESEMLLTPDEQQDLFAAGRLVEESTEELTRFLYEGFQEILKDAVRDRVRYGQVKARADSRARAVIINNLRNRIGEEYDNAKRRYGGGAGS